jgi:hypothetical protein
MIFQQGKSRILCYLSNLIDYKEHPSYIPNTALNCYFLIPVIQFFVMYFDNFSYLYSMDIILFIVNTHLISYKQMLNLIY